MINHYHILGIDREASAEEIKKAYRKLSMKFHPDKNEGDQYFEEWTKKVNAAYEILSNTEKKSAYDFALGQVMEKKETAKPPAPTDNPEMALLKEIRRYLPEFYDARTNLELARNNYDNIVEQGSPVIITTAKAIMCISGIVISIGGLIYLLLLSKK